MKRKALLICIAALTIVLAASSMIAVSQAWRPTKPKPEFVGFDLKMVLGGDIPPGEVVGDTLIIDANQIMLAGNITVDNKVYYYPTDFTHQGSSHAEINIITGEGWIRSENTFIFKLPGKPTLTVWTITRITSTGEAGEFKLTGTKQFILVDGFGLEKSDITGYVRQFGFIKGWPL